MLSENQILNEVREVLEGQHTMDAFSAWLARNSWNMHLDSSRSACEFVAKIESWLSEYDNGHLDEKELVHNLHGLSKALPIVQRIEIGNSPYLKVISEGTQARPIPFSYPQELPVAAVPERATPGHHPRCGCQTCQRNRGL